ncbi:MAG: hypothetical protein ACRYFX_05580 [Janthinobacterium lividum]
MAETPLPVRIPLPLPSSRYLGLACPGLGALLWLARGHWGMGAVFGVMLVAGLLVEQKFELDAARQNYRTGLHWAHLLNPKWHSLPQVWQVVMKPYTYRELAIGRSGNLADQGIWKGFTVLLSVPDSPRGVVVASVVSAMEATSIATEVATALGIPWHRA